MNVTANINKTYLRDDVEHGKVFCKLSKKSYPQINDFQNLLSRSISGKFNVNKYLHSVVKSGGVNTQYELCYEVIDIKPWEINPSTMYTIGKSMSILHMISKISMDNIHIPIKTEKYDSMEKWIFIPSSQASEYAKLLRRDIFRQLKPFNLQQEKIPLHRDFKPHNILFDGNKFHLIDFDFAAVDFTCLEIMAFIVDIMDSDEENIKAFINGYKSTLTTVDFTTMVNDYLVYLCVNTFPFYMKDSLTESGFNNLLDHRNNVLINLWEKKETINKIVRNESN